jgi:hypothetical protein
VSPCPQHSDWKMWNAAIGNPATGNDIQLENEKTEFAIYFIDFTQLNFILLLFFVHFIFRTIYFILLTSGVLGAHKKLRLLQLLQGGHHFEFFC